VRTAAAGGAPVTTSSGLTLLPSGGLPGSLAGVDTLVVPGGNNGTPEPRLAGWLRQHAARARRVTSVWTTRTHQGRNRTERRSWSGYLVSASNARPVCPGPLAGSICGASRTLGQEPSAEICQPSHVQSADFRALKDTLLPVLRPYLPYPDLRRRRRVRAAARELTRISEWRGNDASPQDVARCRRSRY